MQPLAIPAVVIEMPTAVPLDQSAREPAGEAALLITCLRGLPYLVPEDTNWKLLLDLARENGVLLLLHQSLLATGLKMPGFFQDAAEECRVSAQQLAGELEGLLQALQELRVDILPLKGPALALALYGSAALRSSNDLDLLVRSEDFPRCEALLLGQGFIPLGTASEHDRRFLRDNLLVELHFELASPLDFPLDIEPIWSRSRPDKFRGHPIRALSPIDLVLYLCCHGLKHGFSRLIWIMDVARSLGGWQPDAYKELIRHARRQSLEPYLLIACEVVRSMFPQHLPQTLDTVLAASPKAAQRARRAAARLLSEGHEVVINDHRRWYLQAEPSALKRWRYRFRYLAPRYSDPLWARRQGVRSVFIAILRPFRLLQKYGLRKASRIAFPKG
jgi:hypothetical protein